jgi:DNA polymerase-3 subunit alpha
LPARSLNQKALECLAKAGCFDRFDLARKGILDNLERFLEMTAREREQNELGQGFLFDDMPSESLEDELRRADRAENSERLAWEREVLGFYLTGHPLNDYRQQLKRYADCSIADLAERFADGSERVTVGGLITSLKVMSIKKEGRNHGRRLGVFRLEDADGAVRVVAFPDTFDVHEHLLEDGAPVMVVASIKGDGDHVELMADEIVSLVGIDSRRAAALRVVLDLDQINDERLEAIREYLLEHPGELPVRFELLRRGQFRARLVPPPALTVDPGTGAREGLKALLGSGWCEFEFDTKRRNGTGAASPPPTSPEGDSAELVN